ncbi:uncharacterized protein LOC141612394 [Silene latifolia]|uniref:uncharacterized protein LOC141612394 n=1 Tax=Silene latifolia TaxID=37657 RepID=UPI003D77FAFD
MGRKAITTRDNDERKRELNLGYAPLNPAQCYKPLDSITYDGMSSDPPPKRPQVSAEEAAGHLRRQTVRTANAALVYYNRKHSTDYQLVNAVGSNGRLRSGIWYHCNFKAKREKDHKSSAKLFFAEMKVTGVKCGVTNYLVTACRVLDESKTTTGCEMCGNWISHPTRGFREGLYQFQPRSLRPRRDGKVMKK